MNPIDQPRLNQAFTDRLGNLTRYGYSVLSGLLARVGGTSPSYETGAASISLTGSPYTYTNSQSYTVGVIVSGGGCNKVETTRDGITWIQAGNFYREHVLSPGDRLRITYTTAPTVSAIPR